MAELTPKVLALQEECKALGIKFHHKHGAPKLQELIDAHNAEEGAEKPDPSGEKIIPISPERYKKDKAAKARRDASRLVRCRIQCLDPQKKEWLGEMISVGSSKMGTLKKFVPFNTGQPYHIPKAIFDVLDERQCSFFYTETNKLGHKVRRARQGKAFAMEILPPLTKEELKELGRKQAMAQGVSN